MTMETDHEVERLVHENAGLVAALVRHTLRLSSWLPGGYDREDLQSLGNLGLLRAAQTFDPGRGVSFSTYAYRCIKNTIAGALKREADRHIDCLSLSLPIGLEEDSSLEDQIADQTADTTQSALQGVDRELLERAMEGLSERQAEVIQGLYFSGDSVHQVSERCRLSIQAIQNQHLRALRVLRGRLRRLGFRPPT
jgi:RNA polymerase sporulation-specific sigma factor